MPGNSPSDVLVADGVCAVTTTVATPEDARRLAQAVLQQRLAACVQVEPITSHYRWQGALHEEAEWRLVCKTVAGSVAGLLQLLQGVGIHAPGALLGGQAFQTQAYLQHVPIAFGIHLRHMQ